MFLNGTEQSSLWIEVEGRRVTSTDSVWELCRGVRVGGLRRRRTESWGLNGRNGDPG